MHQASASAKENLNQIMPSSTTMSFLAETNYPVST